jgi:hypothetical protein
VAVSSTPTAQFKPLRKNKKMSTKGIGEMHVSSELTQKPTMGAKMTPPTMGG